MTHFLEAKSFKSLPEYKDNPFIEKAISDIKTVKKMQFVQPAKGGGLERAEVQMMVGEKTGEVNGHSMFVRFVEVDEEKFAKVYLSQFEVFWELPQSAIRVFGYILSKLKPKQDVFEFIMDEAKEYTQYKSHHPINAGLFALSRVGIIAKSHLAWRYFINPLVVFNGDRVTFAKTYLKKKKEQNPNQLNLLNEPI